MSSQQPQQPLQPAQRPDELFDVVDSSDRPIRQAPRSEIHKNKLLHRAIHVWVFNTQGQLFLQKRSPHKDTAPNRWDSSCSGHVDAGETYPQAALRELVEEIGLRAQPADLIPLFKVPASEITNNEFVHFYRLSHNGPFTLNPAEVIDGQWLLPDDLTQKIQSTPDDFSRVFAHHWLHYHHLLT